MIGENMMYKSIILVIILSLITCTAVSGDESMGGMIKIKINDVAFDVKLENNSATQELVKELEKGNITVNATEYGALRKLVIWVYHFRQLMKISILLLEI